MVSIYPFSQSFYDLGVVYLSRYCIIRFVASFVIFPLSTRMPVAVVSPTFHASFLCKKFSFGKVDFFISGEFVTRFTPPELKQVSTKKAAEAFKKREWRSFYTSPTLLQGLALYLRENVPDSIERVPAWVFWLWLTVLPDYPVTVEVHKAKHHSPLVTLERTKEWNYSCCDTMLDVSQYARFVVLSPGIRWGVIQSVKGSSNHTLQD